MFVLLTVLIFLKRESTGLYLLCRKTETEVLFTLGMHRSKLRFNAC